MGAVVRVWASESAWSRFSVRKGHLNSMPSRRTGSPSTISPVALTGAWVWASKM
ncbi:hypothetical protein SCALM49S_00580 [Streptomyces californicus]